VRVDRPSPVCSTHAQSSSPYADYIRVCGNGRPILTLSEDPVVVPDGISRVPVGIDGDLEMQRYRKIERAGDPLVSVRDNKLTEFKTQVISF